MRTRLRDLIVGESPPRLSTICHTDRRVDERPCLETLIHPPITIFDPWWRIPRTKLERLVSGRSAANQLHRVGGFGSAVAVGMFSSATASASCCFIRLRLGRGKVTLATQLALHPHRTTKGRAEMLLPSYRRPSGMQQNWGRSHIQQCLQARDGAHPRQRDLNSGVFRQLPLQTNQPLRRLATAETTAASRG